MTDNKIVRGNRMIASIDVGGSFYPVFCAKSCSFELTNEIILRTGVNDGLFPKRRVRRSDWSGSASGVLVTDNTIDRYSPFYLLQEAVRRADNLWQFEFINEDGESKTISGTALIENLPISGDVQGMVQSSVNIVGTGGFEIDASPPSGGTEHVDSDYWITTAGQFSITGDSVNNKDLVGKTLLGVSREGSVYDIITGTTPVGRQCTFNAAYGTVTFDSNIPFNPNETVWCIWKD